MTDKLFFEFFNQMSVDSRVEQNPSNQTDFDTPLTLKPMNDGTVYRLRGSVVNAFRRGSTLLGYPTANMHPLAFRGILNELDKGIYAGFAQVEKGAVYPAVLSLGTNPTFDTTEDSLEVYIMNDFPSDFYNAELSLIIVGYLRESVQFNDLTELTKWIARDVEVARKALKEQAFVTSSKDKFFYNLLD